MDLLDKIFITELILVLLFIIYNISTIVMIAN